MTQTLLFEKHQGLGIVTLNRPSALNALTHDMVKGLDEQLHAWQRDDEIKAVVIQSSHEKAFCAGGDIRYIYETGRQGDPSILDFFWDEYRLNHRIFHYPKPYIAFLDGITMGGGAGIAMHGSHQVGSEQLRFAMPETGIGFFPDIGGGYFLSRCPGKIGVFLSLTGARLKAEDAWYCKLITQAVPHTDFPNALDAVAIIHKNNCNNTTVTEQLTPFHKTPRAPIEALQTLIDEHFGLPSLADIMRALSKSTHPFLQEHLKQLQQKSPLSLAITFQQLCYAENLSFDDNLKMEYRLVNRFLKNPDFYEGVRALIIDKDNQPNWQANTIDDIDEHAQARYFEPLSQELHFNY